MSLNVQSRDVKTDCEFSAYHVLGKIQVSLTLIRNVEVRLVDFGAHLEKKFVIFFFLIISGDNDPIDVVEISDIILPFGIYCVIYAYIFLYMYACIKMTAKLHFESGSITPIKVLGALALIDEKETDW